MANNRPQTLIRPNVRDGSVATEVTRAKIQQCPLRPDSEQSRHGSELTRCARSGNEALSQKPLSQKDVPPVGGGFTIVFNPVSLRATRTTRGRAPPAMSGLRGAPSPRPDPCRARDARGGRSGSPARPAIAEMSRFPSSFSSQRVETQYANSNTASLIFLKHAAASVQAEET